MHTAMQHEVDPEILNVVDEVRQALRESDLLSPMQPERYWRGVLPVVIQDELDTPNGLPVDVEYDKKAKTVGITIGSYALQQAITEYAPGEYDEDQRLLRLFVGYGLVHDLAMRALHPSRLQEFIEQISLPNGLHQEILEAGLIDSPQNHSIMLEYFIGDEDRIPKVNVDRFAIGAVCEVLSLADEGFRDRVTDIYKPEVERFLAGSGQYILLAMERFGKTEEEAKQMFAEHIKNFDLAAAFPKHRHEVEMFTGIYALV